MILVGKNNRYADWKVAVVYLKRDPMQ